MKMETLADLHAYIDLHTSKLGFPPTAVGLPYENYINILMEMGASAFGARCTNLTAALGGVRVVRL